MLESITPAADQFKENAFVIALVLIGLFTLMEIIVVAAIIKFSFVKHVFNLEFGHPKTEVAHGRISATMVPMRGRYIKASELRTFDFCQRAWSLERSGQPSALHKQRAEGEREHHEHAQHAVSTRTAARVAIVLFIFGLVGLALGLALWVVHR